MTMQLYSDKQSSSLITGAQIMMRMRIHCKDRFGGYRASKRRVWWGISGRIMVENEREDAQSRALQANSTYACTRPAGEPQGARRFRDQFEPVGGAAARSTNPTCRCAVAGSIGDD